MLSPEDRAERDYLLSLVGKGQLKELTAMQIFLYFVWFLLALGGGIPAFWMTVSLYVLLFMSVMTLIAAVCFVLGYVIPLLKG